MQCNRQTSQQNAYAIGIGRIKQAEDTQAGAEGTCPGPAPAGLTYIQS